MIAGSPRLRLRALTAAGARTAGRWARGGIARALPTPEVQGPLWILGSAAGHEYVDNSRALHEYLIRTRPDIRVVWCIDRRSDDRAEVADAGEWVDLRSVRAHRYVMAADVLVFSHGIHDLPGMFSNPNATIVRLGHGLTAFKRTRSRTSGGLGRLVTEVDLAPVASELEQTHKQEWGFPAAKLPITGLARWDAMRREQRSTPERDTVLFALTWRDWIDETSLIDSEYWRIMRELDEHRWFSDQLSRSDLTPRLFLHPLVRKALAPNLSSLGGRPETITRGKEIPRALATTALLVTDYSSLAWDALQLGIPVLFFHFDLDEYLADRGAHVDLRARLFGPAVTSVNELSDAILRFLDSGLRFPDFEDDARAWARLAFAFRDDRNCERIVHSIEHLRAGGHMTAATGV